MGFNLTREPLGVPPADRDAAYARGRYQKVTSRKLFISANAHPFSRNRASKVGKVQTLGSNISRSVKAIEMTQLAFFGDPVGAYNRVNIHPLFGLNVIELL